MHTWLPTWCFDCQKLILKSDRSDTPQLCQRCYQKVPHNTTPGCQHCGLPHESSLCTEKWARQITSFHAVFNYEEPIPRWISSLKYSSSFIAGKILQHFLDNWLTENSTYLETVDILVPIPIHPLRLRRRGFNQTRYLLNNQHQFPLKKTILRRIRQTPHQVGLSRKQREKNLRNAFKVTDSLKGKTVLIFDDVCTTGQTLGEATQVIKQAGAHRIDALVLGRAL